MRAFFLALALAGFALAGPAAAQTPVVTVSEPWVRATVAQQQATGAFMRLSASQNARLVAASSPVAGLTEIHEMTVVNDVMRMRAIDALELPAGRTVELRPASYHVMLMDLRQTVNAGDRVAITLVFEDRAQRRFTQQVEATVRGMAAAPPPRSHGHGSPPAPSGTGAHRH
jgi:copper(I)-binding protein